MNLPHLSTALQRRLRLLVLVLALVLAIPAAVRGIHPAPAPAPAAAPTSTATIAVEASLLPAAFPDTHMSQPGDLAVRPPLSAHAASAAPAFPGCLSRPNTNNFSSRRGAAIRNIAAHYTVSRNTPGWADVNAIDDFLNRPSTQASTDFIIDAEGNCLFVNPSITALKAWTEMGGNPFTVAIEFVAEGNEGQLSAGAIAKGGLVISELAQRFQIPLALGDVTGCSPRRAGLVDHAMYGACGGGHFDLRPLFGSSVPRRSGDDAKVLGPLLRAARTHAITATDRRTCGRLNAWRRAGRPREQSAVNVRRRTVLAARGVRCSSSGPVRVVP